MSEQRLTFESVTLEPMDEWGHPVRNISFELAAGDALGVSWPHASGYPSLADAVAGVWPPSVGTIMICGEDWQNCSADAAAQWRSRIGRIFAGTAWLSNLDVDENITLVQRHFTSRPHTEIVAEALDWMGRFGRSALPNQRPVQVSGHDRTLAQWVRALLGERDVLILENPFADVSGTEAERFIAAVADKRAAGCAVLWIMESPDQLNKYSLSLTQSATVKEGVWEMETLG